jgi:hypothetical protein
MTDNKVETNLDVKAENPVGENPGENPVAESIKK